MSSGEPTSVPPLPPDPAVGQPPPVAGAPPRTAPTAPTAPAPPSAPTTPSAPYATVPPVLDPAATRRANQVDPPPGAGADWPAQAADTIVDVVDRVRNATTGPALTVMRGVVYGVAIAIVAIAALVLLLIAAVRFVDAYLPGEVWSAYLLLGSISTILGLVLWSKRRLDRPTTT